LSYQYWGLTGCLWVSTLFLLIAGLLSIALPATKKQQQLAD